MVAVTARCATLALVGRAAGREGPAADYSLSLFPTSAPSPGPEVGITAASVSAATDKAASQPAQGIRTVGGPWRSRLGAWPAPRNAGLHRLKGAEWYQGFVAGISDLYHCSSAALLKDRQSGGDIGGVQQNLAPRRAPPYLVAAVARVGKDASNCLSRQPMPSP
jgi:hypothetical protein